MIHGSVIAALLLGIAIPSGALADHSHHHDATTTGESGSMLSASVGLTAATYRQTSFEGEYQGITPGVHWAKSRFSASTGIGAYRLRKNGALKHGVGDLFVHGQVTLIQPRQEDPTIDPHYHHRHHVEPRRSSHPEGLLGGLGLAVSTPTGSQRDGLGMGHVMVMSALWASWTGGELTLAASGGYGRAIGASQTGEHAHGTGPIVDPMNLSEITWSASGDYQVAGALRLGARLGGAIALDDMGVHRTIGATRAIWSAGRVDTTAEVQVGIAGDPFDVRGMIETALRF